MKTALLTILILISTLKVFSQFVDIDPLKRLDSDSLKSIKSYCDSIYSVQIIPDNALTGEFDLLITGQEKNLKNKINTNLIEISWSSIYIDGRYILVITPRQIYLKSGHDNPNPNYLYWLTTISVTQFDMIKDFLETKQNGTISNYTSDNSTNLTYYFDKAIIEKYKGDCWTNKRYDNFQSLIRLINQPLNKTGEKILIPSRKDFENIRILRLVIDFFELQDQIKMIRIE
jgi:hypothetical protein